MARYLFAALVSCGCCLLFSYVLIPILRRFKAGQNILSYVEEHKKKNGTPTMGGLAFVAATLLTSALFIKKVDDVTILTLAIGIAYMIVGLLDDVLKIVQKQNLGLKAWQKFSFQAVVALFAAIACVKRGWTVVHIPFIGSTISLGFWIIPLVIFAFLATVNAVNLTDGLDGLAASVSLPFFLFLGTVIILQNGSVNAVAVSFALVGALGAYLVFNTSPASVFMGDTGSLALGGFAACLACFTGNVFYLLVIGLPFVCSVLTVIIQVIYFKITKGKRIFLMSPIHHHFQKKGYSESKISYCYALSTIVLGVLCVVTLL